MNINWYSFYSKIRILCIIALALGLLSGIFDISLGENNMFGTSPYDSVPYIVIILIATALSWLMVIKYKSYHGTPEVTSKNASRLYGTIALVLIALFILCFYYVQNIR